jgi:serine O-acetyltransferase
MNDRLLTTDSSMSLRTLLAADQTRCGLPAGPLGFVRGCASDRTFRVMVTYRLLRSARSRWSGPARLALMPLRWAHAFTSFVAGVDLPPQATIGPGFRIFHGRGLAINDAAVIGADVTVFGGVTIGRRDRIDADGVRHQIGAPVLEDRCWIGPNAIIVGPITIGEGARLAGGTVVMRDVPPRSILAGNPGEVIRCEAPYDVYFPSQELP